MKNAFVYVNGRGRKSLTAFAWSLIAVALALIVLAVHAAVRASATRAVFQISPQPVAPAAAPALPEPTIQTSVADGCPQDPVQWSFVDAAPGSNYKRIEPGCVYDNLARTVAWRILSSAYGYDTADAANLLGFGAYSRGGVIAPYHEMDELVLRPFQGEGVATVMPAYPLMAAGLHFWEVNNHGEVATASYILQGCFPTYEVVGNQKHYIWSSYEAESYEVICQVAYDVQPGGWYVVTYGEPIVYSDSLDSGRALMYFGYYRPGATWYFLGLSNENNYTPAAELRESEYALMQEWYGAPAWDQAWFESHRIAAVPLPPGWEQRNTGADLQAITEAVARANQ